MVLAYENLIPPKNDFASFYQLGICSDDFTDIVIFECIGLWSQV
jgi:hypothetical protein